MRDLSQIIPSFYGPKDRLRRDPDLVLQYQLVKIVLADLMEYYSLTDHFTPAEAAARLRETRIEVEADEAGNIFVRRES